MARKKNRQIIIAIVVIVAIAISGVFVVINPPASMTKIQTTLEFQTECSIIYDNMRTSCEKTNQNQCEIQFKNFEETHSIDCGTVCQSEITNINNQKLRVWDSECSVVK